MPWVHTSPKAATVHAANPALRCDEKKPDRNPGAAIPLDHRNRVDPVDDNVPKPVPVAAGVRGLDQTHDLVERRLGDAPERLVVRKAHENKIRIVRTKSSAPMNSVLIDRWLGRPARGCDAIGARALDITDM